MGLHILLLKPLTCHSSSSHWVCIIRGKRKQPGDYDSLLPDLWQKQDSTFLWLLFIIPWAAHTPQPPLLLLMEEKCCCCCSLYSLVTLARTARNLRSVLHDERRPNGTMLGGLSASSSRRRLERRSFSNPPSLCLECQPDSS